MPHIVKHHRLPRSLGGKSNKFNISHLPYFLHVAWHVLFRNWTAHEIAKEINLRYLDPQYELIVRRK